MKTSSFLNALRTHSTLPLVFQAGGEIVSPGYHLTEVKRVSYETRDCGAMTHRWSESQFEIWVPTGEADTGRGHMAARKFLAIVDRVEAELPLNRDAAARIHTSFDGLPAALYDVDAITARDGKLWVELVADRTRCKAAERRVCTLDSGCGTSADTTSDAAAEAAACCSTASQPAGAACCA